MERVIIKDIFSNNLKRNKRLRIILPKDYHSSKLKYQVLYMHDGQNLIDPSPYSNHSWEVIDAIDRYNSLLVVGIDHSDEFRMMEYSNYLHNSAIKHLKRMNIENIHPQANEYGRFIVEEVKPFIDSTFRVETDNTNTYIAGSSCGGNISLYLGLKYQDVFSCIGAFSPAYYIIKKGFYDFLDDLELNQNMKIYYDVGTEENGFFSKIYLKEHKLFDEYIKKKLPQSQLLGVIDKGAKHSEEFWAKRFTGFVEFCLKK
jgi:predicted alpha/beta superfamily hydrolase